LQYIREEHGMSEQVLYVSLDDIWFSDYRLTELAAEFRRLGGTHLFLDEVHKYPEWSREVKNLYDDYPDLKFILTGSSSLQIFRGKGDLSRRAVQYDLHELSLREYLILKNRGDFEPISLKNLLSDHREIASEISARIKPVKMLREYMKIGAYPYVLENPSNYHDRLQETVYTVLETDLPAMLNMDYSSILKLKKLLYLIATSVPFKPNIAELSRKTGIARDTLLRYLHYLEEAQLIWNLKSSKKGMSFLSKPEKIYLHNPNLMVAFGGASAEIGSVRETFFINQVSRIGTVHDHHQADFTVNGFHVFEVGGEMKSKKQIKDLENAFIVSDDMEIGFKNRIPLWMFGFLY
jgi:predicted AAA+ superfamily ATPase